MNSQYSGKSGKTYPLKQSTLINKFQKDFFPKYLRENIYVIALTIFIIAVRIISGFNGLYGQDAYEYLRYTNLLDKFFYHGSNPGHFFWPAGYPLSGSLLNLIIHNTSLSLQLISVLSFIISTVYIKNFLEKFLKEIKTEVKYFVLLFFCFSPYIFRSAFLVMPESLSILCITGFIYHLFLYTGNNKTKDFALAVFFMMFSVITRYANFVIDFIPSIYLFIFFLKKFDFKKFFAGIVIILLMILPHIIISGGGSMDFLSHEWLREWSVSNFFSSKFHTANGLEVYKQFNLIYPFESLVHPAFIFSGILFLFFLRRKDFKSFFYKVLAVSLLIYFVFLAGIPYQDLRFLIPSFPLVILVLFAGYERVTRKFLKQKYRKFLFVIFIVLQIVFIYKYSIGIYTINKFEKETAGIIKNYDSSRMLYTFYLSGALKYYGVKNHLIDLYDVKLSNVTSGSYILFNADKFKKQWADELPMINWNYLKSNYELKAVYKFGNNFMESGWILYEISK